MKRNFICLVSILILICLSVPVFVACDETTAETKPTYTVTVYLSTDNKIGEFTVQEGDVVGRLEDRLTKWESNFYGYVWYTDAKHTNEWDLYKDEVKSGLRLYGRYE